MSLIQEVDLKQVQPLTTEEELAGTKIRDMYAPLLKVGESSSTDFWNYTQGFRQALVSRYLGETDGEQFKVRDDLDNESISTMSRVLNDIDKVTGQIERLKREEEEASGQRDVTDLVVELLRMRTSHKYDEYIPNDNREGTIPTVDPNALNTGKTYTEGELTPVDPDNTLRDVNWFLAEHNKEVSEV